MSEIIGGEYDRVNLFGTTYMLKDAQARNDNGILDKYGALNRTPWVNGQAWTSTLKVTCQNGVYTANGTLTDSGETHYNIYSNTDSLPNGISPGMTLQVTHECESTNVKFRIYNRVNGTNVLLCEIPGNGTKIVTVDENATGMIVRLSYLNGVTYTNMVSKPFIFGTLAKQSIESRFEEDEHALAETLDPNPTKNLFDKYTMTNNLLINANGEEEASGLYVTSDYIKLPIKAVMISSVGAVSRPYIYRIAVYNKEKTWKYRLAPTTDDYMLTVNTSVIPTTDEYYYIRISFEFARETDFDTVQVEVGAQKTDYVPHLMPLDYHGRIRIEEVNSALTEAIENADQKTGTLSEAYGINLFDPTKMFKNTLIDGNGIATLSYIYDSSDFIPIPASKKIIRSFSYTGAPTYRIAFYDSNKNFLFRRTELYSSWENGYSLAITNDCAYARITVENENNTTATVDPFYMVLANGETIPEFVPYFTAIDLKARNNIDENGSTEKLKDYVKTNETKNGLQFTWSGNTCSIIGQVSTALCFNVIKDSRAALPDWMEPGQTLYANIETTNENVRFNFEWYLDGGSNTYDYFTKDGFVTVPDDAIGVIIRLSIPSGASIGSARITCNLFTAGTNPYLSKVAKRITEEFERRVGTVDDATTPMLTIIDDDGNKKFYTDLYPIAVEKKVPIATAVPFTFMGIDANHLTREQVLEMYANGIEILSHTYSHMTTTTATEQEYEQDYQKAKNNYELIGIKCELLVYAGGSANAANAIEAAKRVYSGAFNSGKEHTNFSDKNDKYSLERYGITDSNDDGRIDGTDLAQLKALIDSVKQTGGWMVWMTHTSGSYWSETMRQNIADVIDYSLAQGVPVVTAAYGFRKYFGV